MLKSKSENRFFTFRLYQFAIDDVSQSETELQVENLHKIHMLEGAETKNMKAYIQESVGIRKDAELCIFHVGSNDISSKRTESQYNTDLMILFGACRTSFPNARLCCSSGRVSG